MPYPSRTVEFVARHEGFVPHLYKDTRGYLTFGYGFRPPLEAYPWLPDARAAHADADALMSAPAGKNHRFYAKLCRASLSEAACRQILGEKLETLARSPILEAKWRFLTLPKPAQVALLDMAYNLGVAGLDKFFRLRAAVVTSNWAIAARECERQGPSKERNAATAALFLECLQSAKPVQKQS